MSALHHVKTVYEPQIAALRKEWREAIIEIEKNCTEQLKELR